jgi:hypothetical protein
MNVKNGLDYSLMFAALLTHCGGSDPSEDPSLERLSQSQRAGDPASSPNCAPGVSCALAEAGNSGKGELEILPGGSGRGSPAGSASTCASAECGPMPLLPTYECADGSIGGLVGCQRSDAGQCGWLIVACPSASGEQPNSDETAAPPAGSGCASPVAGGGASDCSAVPQCEFACPEGTSNPVDDRGCLHTCECVRPEGACSNEPPCGSQCPPGTTSPVDSSGCVTSCTCVAAA